MDMKDPAPDLSSYLFFEASGDSEVDCDPIMGENAYEIARADDYGDDQDDDDAQSCSYDGSDTCNAAEFNGYDESGDEYDDEKRENDEEKEGVYGISYCEDDEMQEQQQHKSFVSFDSGQEFKDEMEKNRLFWEACLAS